MLTWHSSLYAVCSEDEEGFVDGRSRMSSKKSSAKVKAQNADADELMADSRT